MKGKQTAMMAFTGMAILATMMTISSPTPVLAAGHWNVDGDFTQHSNSELAPESAEEMPMGPLSGGKLPSTESAMTPSIPEAEEQQPSEVEEIPVIQGSDEICGDGIDNDNDALVDFIDEQCNLESQPEQHQQQLQQQPPLQQEQFTVSTQEICDDDLDNDFDGKVDSRDEECSYITTGTSSFQSPRQAQPVTDENTEGEIEDTEQQPNEDLSEESVGNSEENNDVKESREDENEDENTGQPSDDEGNDDDGDDDDDGEGDDG